MSIRTRLTLAYLVVATVLLAVGAVLFTRQVRSGLVASVDTGLRTRADQLVQAAGNDEGAVEFQDERTRLIAPRESFAQVVAADGSLVESSGAIGNRLVLTPAQLRSARLGIRLFGRRLSGEPIRLLAAPVARSDGTWIVVVGSDLGPTEEAVARVRGALFVGGALLILAGGIGAWILARAALRPVERLRQEVAEISARDPAAVIEVPDTGDEIAALAATMNDLLGRLQATLRHERRLVADAGHELRTPLAVLQVELELASRRGRSREELARAVTAAAEETRRLARLADGLLLLATSDEGELALERREQALLPLLEGAAEAIAGQARSAGVSVAVEVDAGLLAPIDGLRVRQALDNLLHNAVRAAPPGTGVTARAWTEGRLVFIEVADAGSGFPPDFLPHAFERFRRADEARAREAGGAGIGLAIVRAIAQAHAGEAEAWNRPEGGAVVRITLPVPPGDASVTSGGEPAGARRKS